MENLEKQCLEKLNNILFKFDLNIEHIASSDVWQYRLIDNRASHNSYFYSLCFWLSIL